jgi:dsDNA-binding SOS-regulon protein
MSFGLKNAGATYQRAIQACFKRQLNKNVEAYVDDVVVKTRNSSSLINDLEETFASLREYRWMLNPNKCVFGVPSGKLLGFIISQRGIEANPKKISAITNMKAPTSIKDVQKLKGCTAALNRFISRLGEQGIPFFKLLKHQEKFVWTPEADQALAQLKDFLSKPPILTTPRKGEQLLLYLAATTHVVSTAIVLSGKKTATPTQSRAQSTSSARFYQSPRHAISPCRSSCTQYSSPRESYDTTSSSTQYPSSPITRSATSCGTKMLLEESPSGRSSSAPSLSTSSHAQPSSRRR